MLALTLATIVAMLGAPAASAVSVRRTWTAHLGGNGANGTATLKAFWTGNGSITYKLTGLQPSTTYPVVAYRGSCAKPSVITRLPGAVTNAEGALTKTSAVSTRIMNSIWRYGRCRIRATRFFTSSRATSPTRR